MVSRVRTVAFQGVEAVPVDVQVLIAPGKVGMGIVGLADKAVTESRERVQAALHASGLSMPPKRVTVNLAPADLPKEGSYYDAKTHDGIRFFPSANQPLTQGSPPRRLGCVGL